MKPKTITIAVLMVGFVIAISFALLREVGREEARIAGSLSGVVEVDPRLFSEGLADIVRTDRLVLYLVDPVSKKPVALNILNPLVPPQVFQIGQEYSNTGQQLSGSYLLVGITDKDGEIFKITPGEVYGRSSQAITLGTEQIRFVLNEPFRGDLFNRGRGAGGGPAPSQSASSRVSSSTADAALTIRGTVRVAGNLQSGVERSDRMVILLMDSQLGRPVASKIIPHVLLPQRFSISAPPGSEGKAYSLRILTDKDGQPVNSVPGEVIGRSKAPIPLGTKDLDFVLDTPFRR